MPSFFVCAIECEKQVEGCDFLEILSAIKNRRSIRAFKEETIPFEILQEIILMGTKAPSGKNRQPWKFVVLQNHAKQRLADLMDEAAQQKETCQENIGSLRISSKAIRQASAICLVYNAYSKCEQEYSHHRGLMDTQSIGAAVQNMILAATSFGLGTLWICDVFQCEEAINTWIDTKDELICAVAIGEPNQVPYERMRKPVEEIVRYMY